MFDNPNSLLLGAGAALAFGSLLPEVFPLEFGAQEVALEALEIFLAASEMVPTTELARELELQLEKNLVRIPEIEPVMDLGIAQSNQLVLSSQPWVSSSIADRLTLLNIALPAALVAPGSLEEDLVSTVKALEQVLDNGSGIIFKKLINS